MTGIERLRNLAQNCLNGSVNGYTTMVSSIHAAAIDAIADQIVREQDEVARTDWDAVREVAADMSGRVFMSPTIDDLLNNWSRKLTDAADGHGHDHSAEVSVSAYDLLSQEERDAITWVRAHGGLGAVTIEHSNLWGTVNETRRRLGVDCAGDLTADAQAIWRKVDRLKSLLGDSVPRAAYERHLARRQRQVDESHAALRRRNGRIAVLERERDEDAETIRGLRALLADVIRGVQAQCEAFGVDVSGCGTAYDMLHDMNEALSFRLMPEGMEWPRFEDGEPVRIGGEFASRDDGEVFAVRAFTIEDDSFDIISDEFSEPYNMGERVKRPTPKVLDADGVEIRVGDTVWHVETGEQCKVVEADSRSVSVDFRVGGDCTKHTGSILPVNLTHRAPVLASDGKPLREGEAVWYLDHIDPLEVRSVSTTASCGSYVKAYNDYEGEVSAPARCFSHKRPEVDSWERLERDANVSTCTYFGATTKDCEICGHVSWECSYDKARDLVRRAKALAGGAK